MAKKIRRTSRKKNKRPMLFIGLAVLVIAIVVAGVLWHNHSSNKPSSEAAALKGISTTNAPASSSTTAKQSGTSSSTSSPASTPPSANNLTLIAPYGTLVSNHKPGQNGSPLQESSVCNTTPSANCYISFTNNGVTKRLPTETTDSSGAAYWQSWTPSSIGLTAGNWTVTAVATYGSKTDSTKDPNPLVVSQ